MPEPSLRDVQRWMQSRILPPERAAAEALSTVELNPQAGDPGVERLSVYSGGYVARMQEALEEAYEAVRHVLGARAFGELARGYAARYPSRDYNLSMAGRNLPVFLGFYPLTRELPFLPDLAALEWKVVEAFHAFDRPPLDPARLAAIPPEDWDRLRLAFQPSVGRIASAWPVLDVWEARKQPVGEVRIDLANRPQRVLVARRGLEVRCELMDELQDKTLAALLEGKTLGEVCGQAAAEADGGSPPLAEWFTRWAGNGLVAEVSSTPI